MLKFGQVIDVTMLDTLGLRNKGADELREALKSQVGAGLAGYFALVLWGRTI
jgi:hypothetical protein